MKKDYQKINTSRLFIYASLHAFNVRFNTCQGKNKTLSSSISEVILLAMCRWHKKLQVSAQESLCR